MKHALWYAVRVAKTDKSTKWWDMPSKSDKPQQPQKNNTLTKLVKLLMPGLLGGLMGLKLSPKQQPPKSPADVIYLSVQKLLSDLSIDNTYDPSKKTWKLPGNKQITQKGNYVILSGPGLSGKATSKNLTVLLNKFVSQ